MDQAKVFLIICHDSEGNFEEVSSAHTSRKDAELSCENLNINHPDYDHTIKVLPLNGAREEFYNDLTFSFGKIENK